MNFKEEFKAVKTFEELFDYREKLLCEIHENSSDVYDSCKMRIGENARFYKEIVEQRINVLVREGNTLDQIEKDSPRDGK